MDYLKPIKELFVCVCVSGGEGGRGGEVGVWPRLGKFTFGQTEHFWKRYTNNHALKLRWVLNRIIKTSQEAHFFQGTDQGHFGRVCLNLCDWKFDQIYYFVDQYS